MWPRIPRFPFRTLLILLSSSLSCIFVALLCLQIYLSARQHLRSETEALAERRLDEQAYALDQALSRAQTVAKTLSEDEKILSDVFSYYSMDARERSKTQSGLYAALQKMRAGEPSVNSLFFITDGGVVSVGDLLGPVSEQDFRSHYGMWEDAVFYHEPAAGVYGLSRELTHLDELFFFAAPIAGRGNGVVCVTLRQNYLSLLLRDSEGLAVVGSGGRVYFNNTPYEDAAFERASVGHAWKDGTLLRNRNPTFEGLCVYMPQDLRELRSEIAGGLPLTLLLAALTLVLTLISSRMLASLVTKPLNTLTKSISGVGVEGREAPLPPSAHPPKRRGLSLRQYILLYFLSTVMLPVLIFSGAAVYTNSAMVGRILERQLNASISSAAQDATELFKNIRAASVGIAYDEQVCRPLAEGGDIPEDLHRIIPYDFNVYRYDVEIAVYDRLGALKYRNSASIGDETVAPSPGGGSEPNWRWSVEQRSRHGRYITLDLGINQPETLERLGYYKCRIDELFLENCYSPLSKLFNYCFIYSSAGEIVSHTNKNLIGTRAALPITPDSPSEQVLLGSKLGETGFYMAAVFDRTLVDFYKFNFFLNTFYLLIISLLAIMLLSILLSYGIAKSIGNFVEQFSEGDQLEPSLKLTEPGFLEEVYRLNKAFRYMSERIRALIADSIAASRRQLELNTSRQKAEFALLQAQINPHFLYNTFESINYMIRTDEKAQAVQMINTLSSMLRFAVKKDEPYVSLAAELRYAEMYVSVMNIRFHDILTVDFAYELKDLSLLVFKFILQPLIENAIYHGIKPKGCPGRVRVACAAEGDALLISVSDDGVGIEPEALSRLALSLDEETAAPGIGLCNIHRRVRMSFGAGYGVSLRSVPGSGTTVTVRLPRIDGSAGNAAFFPKRRPEDPPDSEGRPE